MNGTVPYRRILWIEDDYHHIKNLLRPLVREGWTVVPARSLEEGKAILAKQRDFGLIILDLLIPFSETELVQPSSENLLMPDEKIAENGLAMFDFIESTVGRDVPVLLLSVVNTERIIDSLMRRGVAKRLEKGNLSPRYLRATILESLGIQS